MIRARQSQRVPGRARTRSASSVGTRACPAGRRGGRTDGSVNTAASRLARQNATAPSTAGVSLPTRPTTHHIPSEGRMNPTVPQTRTRG